MRTRSTLAVLFFFTAACGDSSKENPTEATNSSGAAADDSAADDSTTAATSPDTGISSDPDTGGEVPTTGAPDDNTTAADDDTGDDDAGDDDTGEPDGTTTDVEMPGPVDPDIVSSCQDYCDRWAECGLQPDAAACVDGCAQNIGVVEGACKAAQQDQLACVTALSCEQIFDTLGDGGPCADKSAAVASACQGSEDRCSSSLGGEDDACSLSIQCGDEPAREIQCDADSCSCIDGGEKVGECAADGACMAAEGLDAKISTCCGF